MKIAMGQRFLFLAVLAALGAAGVAGAYQHQQNQFLAAKVERVESQLVALSETLSESEMLSQEGRQLLQEYANRTSVIAESQDERLTDAVAKATPAVVSIVVSKDVPLLEVYYTNPFGDDPFFRDFDVRVPSYRQVGTERQQVGAGTGFFVSSDGYIVTNRHVVDDPEASYTVLLANGEQKEAVVIRRDQELDLAVLKVPGSGYTPLLLGDSSGLELGQTVVAIGNALGEFDNSVSVGIVSGLNRTVEAFDASLRESETLSGVIQTDAAINRGNSGGPLIDLAGRAVGINVATQLGANNIGFAIPINDAKALIQEVVS